MDLNVYHDATPPKQNDAVCDIIREQMESMLRLADMFAKSPEKQLAYIKCAQALEAALEQAEYDAKVGM